MYISSLTIRNFRNFENAVFKFNKGVNTLIGENGSGKTNVFYALRMLLDSKLPRYANNLLEGDFNRSLDNWRGHWIVISLNFEELTADEVIQCLSFLEAGIPDGTNRGNYNYFFRPKYHVRKELFEISNGEERNEDVVREKLNNLTIADYEYVITVGASNMDFSNDEFYSQQVGDFDTLTFPNPEEDDISALGQFNNVLDIYNDISCTFAEALRDVVSDLKSSRNNPLITLLKSREHEIDDETSEEIQTTIKGLNKKISNLEPVRGVSSGIVSTIKDTVGETYAPSVDIEANLPDEMSNLLRSLALKVGDGDEPDYKGRIEELSLGGANLIYLSLKLLEYSLELKKDKAAHFLLIEEPEAHIHTHIQKTLFQKIKDDNTQIIYSTHSTHISEVSKISSVNILARKVKKAEVYYPSNGLTEPEVTKLERYLDAIRTTLLFAKSVILVEGDAELILIPAMVKKVYGISLDELGISLINIGSTGFQNVAQIFHPERIRKKCAILTDLDESIFELPDNAEDDNDEQKDARNSQIAGARRKTELDEFCDGNEWLSAFYAPYTFEVVLISYEENEDSICNVVGTIYEQEAAINQSKERLRNADVAIYGKEILRLAKKEKKGWFAIKIANNIDDKFTMPEYIDDALSFVNDSISNTLIVKIACYRLSKNDMDTEALIAELKHLDFNDMEEVRAVFNSYKEIIERDFVVNIIDSRFPEDHII